MGLERRTISTILVTSCKKVPSVLSQCHTKRRMVLVPWPVCQFFRSISMSNITEKRCRTSVISEMEL